MNLISKNTQIPDMYNLRHKQDTISDDFGFNYEEKLLERTLSPVLYNNNNTESVLNKLNDLMATIISLLNPVKNLFYYTHDKNYNRHGRY